VRLHHTDDAVVAEFDLLGTHLGELMGIPPTGKTFRCPVIAMFFFAGEKIVIERIYFDTLTIMSQLGVLGSPIDGAS
jgi:predicted ester cyclase